MNFQLFKNEKKSKETHPDYLISAKNEEGRYEEIGGGWIKEMKNGRKYISCKIDDKPKLTPEEAERIKNLREQAQEKQAQEDFNIF